MEGVTGSSPVPPRLHQKRSSFAGCFTWHIPGGSGGVFHVKRAVGVLLGVDVGTSGLKALLLAPDGRVVASVTEPYPLDIPRPGWAQQDPELWWKACVSAIRTLVAKSPAKVVGLGLTGQMHGSVFLDRSDRVLTPALLWCDQRTSAECDEITERVGGPKALLALTFNPALTGFTAPKILWVRRHLPEVFRKTERVLLPKDFVRLRLTGRHATDVADASGTLLFDVRRRTWSEPMLKALGLPRRWFPDAFEGCEVTGAVTAAVARLTGLPEGTPVVAGGGDQAAGAIGCGVIEPGVVSASLGTSGVVFAACECPKQVPDGRLHLFCSSVKGGWHCMGVMLAAGGALRWYRDTLGVSVIPAGSRADPYDIICREASKVPAGSDGVVFLPYLTGERTPHADPWARGVLYGLSLKAGPAHLARAVLEGVAYGMRDSVELVRGLGVHVARIRLSGGGARNPFWCRMQAAVYGATTVRLVREEGPAMGAAMLAGIGTSVFRSYRDAVRTCVSERDRFASDPALRRTYDAGYRVFRDLYPALRPIFRSAAE